MKKQMVLKFIDPLWTGRMFNLAIKRNKSGSDWYELAQALHSAREFVNPMLFIANLGKPEEREFAKAFIEDPDLILALFLGTMFGKEEVKE